MISRKLAEVLRAKPGDRLWIELLEGRRGWHELHIQGLIKIMITELAILVLLALPVGLWIGTEFAGVSLRAASTETIRLPLLLSSQTYATAVIVVLLSAAISFAFVGWGIRKLDLIDVVRARDQ